MTDFYDDLDTRDPEVREKDLFDRLPGQLANARQRSATFGRLLRDIDPEDVTTRKALAALPVLRKSQLQELQKKNPPLGGLATTAIRDFDRIYVSPGPIYEPESRRSDYWRMARALYAAGFRKGDLVHNTFAYHFTPGGWMLESGARALGCPVFPAGVGQTEWQVGAIADLKPRGYVGTPSFLKIILDKAAELDLDVSSLKNALVSGEALISELRREIERRGINIQQCYATADIGLIAYESDARDGLIVDEDVIVEILRPGTGDPVPEGEVGEVTVTTFNPDYPLIRFATGDLSAVLPGPSPCGRTAMRIRGWMGRADQTTKIKGMFVHPGQVAVVVKRHPDVLRARLVVDRDGAVDRMTLHCEVGDPADEALQNSIAKTLHDVCKLKGEVALAAAGELPNDGKIIDDVRSFD